MALDIFLCSIFADGSHWKWGGERHAESGEYMITDVNSGQSMASPSTTRAPLLYHASTTICIPTPSLITEGGFGGIPAHTPICRSALEPVTLLSTQTPHILHAAVTPPPSPALMRLMHRSPVAPCNPGKYQKLF